ncbi:NAD(P)/FAD-dependent oxidoreductase, partial [Streptomyces sp. MCAF7]
MRSYRKREPGSDRRVVIVGGGMAGSRLAQQLAATAGGSVGGFVEVTIIGEEPHPAYNRVLLAEVLAGRYAPDVIALPDLAVGRRLSGVRVVRLDRDPGEVVCDDGRRVPYDALVLATGSNPVLPPLRGLFEPHGHDLPDGVHAFRTMDDCLALAAAVRPGVRAVVIGGGLLGVSAARALAQRGAQVVLAHQGEHLMERQLDTGAAAMLRRHVAAPGLRPRGRRLTPGCGQSCRRAERVGTTRPPGRTRQRYRPPLRGKPHPDPTDARRRVRVCHHPARSRRVRR